MTLLAALLILAFQADGPSAQPVSQSQILWDYRCKSCHEPAQQGAPDRAVMARMKPAAIVRSLERGHMKAMGSTLTPEERRMIAAFVAGR